jgi:hypothetical protein
MQMLSHEKIKKIILEYFRKDVLKGKFWVVPFTIDSRLRKLRKAVSEYSVEQLQVLEKTYEKKLPLLQNELKEVAVKIEDNYVATIRSGNTSQELPHVLKLYGEKYNEYKIQINELDEIKKLIYGDTAKQKTVEQVKNKRSKPVKTNLTLDDDNEFLRRGGGWIIRFKDKQEIVVPHRVGFTYIAYLLEQPNTFHDCDTLITLEIDRGEHFGAIADDDLYARQAKEYDVKISDSMRIQNQQDSIRSSDSEAIAMYKKRYDKLKELLEDELLSEDKRLQYENERDELIKKITDGGPRGRLKSKDDDRKKKSVAKAITDAINTVREYDDELADHLHNSITSGKKVIYAPKGQMSWTVDLHPPKNRNK